MIDRRKMPRTSKIECPGCPSLRALTFDVLGLIKGMFIVPFSSLSIFWDFLALIFIYR